MSEVTRLTPFLSVRRSEHWENYYIWCPGCKEAHGFRTKAPTCEGPKQLPLWKFDGNIQSPSFTPSLLYLRHLADYAGCGPRCHIVVTDGKVNFCADCEHEYAGKTIDLLPIPEEYGLD
jgi:hypothetical protein